jgi:two-component system response regulator
MIVNNRHFFILHGEDDDCDIRVMARILKKIKYQGEYRNIVIGSDLLTWMNDLNRTKLPDLLILDIGLPGANGKEILASLRQEDRTMSIPTIMMSGSNSQRDYHECISLGANAYIQKNLDSSSLEFSIKCFIEGFMCLNAQIFF